jgi:hypothetical protein
MRYPVMVFAAFLGLAACGGTGQSTGPPTQEAIKNQELATNAYCSASLGPVSEAEAADAGDATQCPLPGQCLANVTGPQPMCVQELPDGAPFQCPPAGGTWVCIAQSGSSSPGGDGG